MLGEHPVPYVEEVGVLEEEAEYPAPLHVVPVEKGFKMREKVVFEARVQLHPVERDREKVVHSLVDEHLVLDCPDLEQREEDLQYENLLDDVRLLLVAQPGHKEIALRLDALVGEVPGEQDLCCLLPKVAEDLGWDLIQLVEQLHHKAPELQVPLGRLGKVVLPNNVCEQHVAEFGVNDDFPFFDAVRQHRVDEGAHKEKLVV